MLTRCAPRGCPVQHCLRGQQFPKDDLLPHDVASVIQTQVLRFICTRTPSTLPDSTARQLLRNSAAKAAIPLMELLPGPYPRLQALLLIDTKAFLEALTCVFDEAIAAGFENGDRRDDGDDFSSLDDFMHRPSPLVRPLA